MIWLLGTLANGETLEYGIPLDEPFFAILRDAEKFVTLEIREVQPNV